MRKSKEIALSAMVTVLLVIAITIGTFFPVLDYSCLMITTVISMIMLSKNSVRGAIMSFMSTVLLSAILFGAVSLQTVVPYALFFGLHAIVIYVMKQRKLNKVLGIIIRDVWFVLSMLIVEKFFVQFFVVDNQLLKQYLELAIIVIGGLVFVPYDYFIQKFLIYMQRLIERLKL